MAALVQLHNIPGSPMNVAAYQYLSKLTAEETKLQLSYEKAGEPVTLAETGSGNSVNKTLREALTISWQKQVQNDSSVSELIDNYSKLCLPLRIATFAEKRRLYIKDIGGGWGCI
jgi:hypothetical protein